jgi:hypothetical protein
VTILWPTKIPLFSSAADENNPIFVDFIPSAYFRRGTDENSYFRRLLVDKNSLFSCNISKMSLAFLLILDSGIFA